MIVQGGDNYHEENTRLLKLCIAILTWNVGCLIYLSWSCQIFNF